MPVSLPSREHMEQVVASMRETLRVRQAAAPEPINAVAAASLFEPIPLVWGTKTFTVRNISYREGLRLHRLSMRFEKHRQNTDPTEVDIEEHEALLSEILSLFASFLDPQPSVNPFEDASPLEVGALSGFFSICQRNQNDPRRFPAIRLSHTTS